MLLASRCLGVRSLSLTAVASELIVFFFFQAEDGIRDYKVTGVQTCALPILWMAPSWPIRMEKLPDSSSTPSAEAAVSKMLSAFCRKSVTRYLSNRAGESRVDRKSVV